MFFSWHRQRGVSRVVLMTSNLQATSVLSGRHKSNTCDLEVMSQVANRSDVQPGVLHIHHTIPCISRSMVKDVLICIETTGVHDTSITLNNQNYNSPKGQ